jgi:5-methylcytosine-specific restriction enzyme subunit McrC
MPSDNLPRIYVLQERRPAVCRLAPADVAMLRAEHRGHLDVLATHHRHHYCLRPTGHVGTILTPHCRLVIRPKIPLDNLFYLLDPAGPVPVIADQTRAVPGAEQLDFLAGRLARLMTERAAAGLHRAYTERADQGPYLQGSLDVPAHLRNAGSRKDQLHSRYEEFTPDVPWNQLPKATAELALRSPLLGEGVRTALRRSLDAYAGVRSLPVHIDSFLTVMPDRLTEPYRPLLDLCRLLVEGLSPGADSGPTPYPAFLLDMQRVFEQYVTAGVQQAFAGSERFQVWVQPWLVANRPGPAQHDIPMRPDLVIVDVRGPVLIGDAKWKRLPATHRVTGDVYQLLAYGAALGGRRGVLVYPGRRDRRVTYVMARSPWTLEIRTLRVAGSRAACKASLERFGRSLWRSARAGDA